MHVIAWIAHNTNRTVKLALQANKKEHITFADSDEQLILAYKIKMKQIYLHLYILLFSFQLVSPNGKDQYKYKSNNS